MTHADLADIARRWLLRAESKAGAGCMVAFTEVGALWESERADAWGCRWGWKACSVVVEVKVSRSDFLRDRAKPHRTNGGVGEFRYFLCPEGVIQIGDLPDRWGLLWVNQRGQVRVLAGHITCNIRVPVLIEGKMVPLRNEDYIAELWRHDACVINERSLLTHILHRVGEPEKLLKTLRKNVAEKNRLALSLDTLRPQLKDARTEICRLRCLLEANGITGGEQETDDKTAISGIPWVRNKGTDHQ